MQKSNGNTVKWIVALSVSVVMGFAGWTLFAMNGSKLKHMEETSSKVERNSQEIGLLKTQNGIVITKLEYLERSIGRIEDLLKKQE